MDYHVCVTQLFLILSFMVLSVLCVLVFSCIIILNHDNERIVLFIVPI